MRLQRLVDEQRSRLVMRGITKENREVDLSRSADEDQSRLKELRQECHSAYFGGLLADDAVRVHSDRGTWQPVFAHSAAKMHLHLFSQHVRRGQSADSWPLKFCAVPF